MASETDPAGNTDGAAAGNADGNGRSVNERQALYLPGGYRVEKETPLKRGKAPRPENLTLIREDGSIVETFSHKDGRIIEEVAWKDFRNRRLPE